MGLEDPRAFSALGRAATAPPYVEPLGSGVQVTSQIGLICAPAVIDAHSSRNNTHSALEYFIGFSSMAAISTGLQLGRVEQMQKARRPG